MMNWVSRRFVSIVLVVLLVVVSATFVGCSTNNGEDIILSDSESDELFLLDSEEVLSVWWDGTPGAVKVYLNAQMDQITTKQHFFLRNNTDKKIVVNVECANFESAILGNNKITLKPNQVKKSFVEFDPNLAKKTENSLGADGPDLDFTFESNTEDTKKSLCICVSQNDPDISIKWDETEDYNQMDYSDKITKSLTVTNNGATDKSIKIYKPANHKGEYYSREQKHKIEPGQSLSFDYDIFYANCDCECGQGEYVILIESDSFYHSNQIFTKLGDNQDWITKWKDNPDQKIKEINISPGEIIETTIMLTNPCDKGRIFRPKLFKATRLFNFSFPEEEYKVSANSVIEIPLSISVNPEERNFVSGYSVDVDFLKKYGAKSSYPLKLDINFDFKTVGKERFKTKLGLPVKELENTNYKILFIHKNYLIVSQLDFNGREDYDIANKNIPLLICVDTNSGEILWDFYDKDITSSIWYNRIGNKLYFKTIGNRGADFYDASGDFYCINLDNGNVVYKTNVQGSNILFNPDDGFYFVVPAWVDEEKSSYSRIDLETGEKTDHIGEQSEVLSIIRGTDYRFIDGNLYNDEPKKSASIRKIDTSTGEIVWEISDNYEYNQIFDYSVIKDDQPALWRLGGCEGVFWYTGARLQIPDKYIYYVFGKDAEIEEYVEGFYSIVCDGIGCINSETGEIIWENTDMGKFKVSDGIPTTKFDEKVIRNTVSKKTGETIEEKSDETETNSDESFFYSRPYRQQIQFQVNRLSRKINKEDEGLSSIAIEYKKRINVNDYKFGDSVYTMIFGPEDFTNTLCRGYENYVIGEDCMYALFDNMVVCYEKQEN